MLSIGNKAVQKVIISILSVFLVLTAQLRAQVELSALSADAVEYLAKMARNTEFENGNKSGNMHPDTLIVTFTKAPLIDTCTVWDSLLMFIPAGSPEDKAYPVKLYQRPEPVTQDSLVWEFVLLPDSEAPAPREGDKVFLNPAALRPCGAYGNQERNIVKSFIFSDVEGVNINSAGGMTLFGKIEGRRVVIPVDTIPVVKDNEVIGYKYERRWIPPAFFQEDGTVDERAQENCKEENGYQELVVYPENCLSAVVIYSRASYTAHVSIYDHLGKFVHSSV